MLVGTAFGFTLRSLIASISGEPSLSSSDLYRLQRWLRRTSRHSLRSLFKLARYVNPSSWFRNESPLTLRELPGHLGLDIGGTLAKLVVATHDTPDGVAQLAALGPGSRCFPQLSFDAVGASPYQRRNQRRPSAGVQRRAADAGRSVLDHLFHTESSHATLQLRFVSVGTAGLEQAVRKLRSQFALEDMRQVREIVTAGGGGHKFAAMFREVLRVQLVPFKELQAVVDGLLFLSQFGPEDELYCQDDACYAWPETLFPFVLVNMGSGVSVLRVDGPQHFTRIGGTSVGGATFLGLSRALTGVGDFRELMRLAARGDASAIDKSVGDIYGAAGCTDLGMPHDLTAASFAKLSGADGELPAPASAPDLVAATLRMVAQVSTVIAIAHAKQIGCMDRVFFVGGFLQNNDLAQSLITTSMLSLGGRAIFCRHAPFLGALGSLAASLQAERERHEPPTPTEAEERWKQVRYANRTRKHHRNPFSPEGAPSPEERLPCYELDDDLLLIAALD